MDTNVVHDGPDAVAAIPLVDWLIRDLVEVYPVTMRVLSPMGFDLCCGGGHPLGEALDLHGLDRERVLGQIAEVILAEPDARR